MEILDCLLVACGCDEKRAQGTIDAVYYYFGAPDLEQKVATCILDWYDYAVNQPLDEIKNIGAFIASRVRRLGIPPKKYQQDRLLREFVRLLLDQEKTTETSPPQSHSVPVVQRRG